MYGTMLTNTRHLKHGVQMTVNLGDFEKQAECTYKDERYSVRDNGAVLRHTRRGKPKRRNDNEWTFGTLNNKTGYLEIASVRIHRIIAVAFHGEPPTKEHVIDHIDTNKQNNRPENLRWVTRLENILLNPITLRRIELACGCSIEEFLTDPSRFRDRFPDPNYQWMSRVSAEEAQVSKERLLAWAKSDKTFSGGSLGDWINNRGMQSQYIDDAPEITNSLTSNAVQKDWKTPSQFPCCPSDNSSNPIDTYHSNLKEGEIFSQNEYFNSIIRNFALSQDGTTLWVLCENSNNKSIKPWLLTQVTYENELFVHSNLGSFFQKDGAEKYFTIAQGLEWTKGDVFDDLI